MLCEKIENRILDYQEDQLPSAQRDEIAAHLAACVHCRTFFRQLREMDVALVAKVKIPKLSAGFDRRLREQIQSSGLSETQRAERKRQLQSEFETGMARIRKHSFALPSLLGHLIRPALGIMAGWLIWRLAPSMLSRIHLDGFSLNVLAWSIASLVFLAINWNEAFPQKLKIFTKW